MRLAATMIVGPGEADRHLERCLAAAAGWADRLLVYGDAPDTRTRDLIHEYATVAVIGDENLYETGEHLVRNRMLELADAALDVEDIIVSLDADEEIHASSTDIRRTLHALATDPAESWNVHFLHLWTPDGTMHRVDGLWQPSVGPRVYRHRKGYRLEPLYGSAWVCPGLPPHLLRAGGAPLFDILHWSYARPRDRRPKWERYTRLPGHHPTHIDSIIRTPVLDRVPCR